MRPKVKNLFKVEIRDGKTPVFGMKLSPLWPIIREVCPKLEGGTGLDHSPLAYKSFSRSPPLANLSTSNTYNITIAYHAKLANSNTAAISQHYSFANNPSLAKADIANHAQNS
ncbi:hypothetical protein ACH5RR_012181 [Cinchona calisaya]|uniref:Uncharacterized protein n=1 Tax=Cinchona calisaya TaxID=153742 RepID=A0ABD3A6Y0_9GENT